MIVQVKRRVTVAVAGALLVGVQAVRAQHDVAPIAAPGVMTGVKQGGSANVHVVCHIPLGGYFRVMTRPDFRIACRLRGKPIPRTSDVYAWTRSGSAGTEDGRRDRLERR